MLGKVVGQLVLFAWYPIDAELALFDAVSYPMEAHANCFGAFVFDCAVGKADGG